MLIAVILLALVPSANRPKAQVIPIHVGALSVGWGMSAGQDHPSDSAANDTQIQRTLVTYTGWLVFVGAITAAFICWQAYETRRAVSVQITSARPWLIITNWAGVVSGGELDIQADISNRSQMPLTFLGMSIKINGQRIDIEETKFLVPDQPYLIQVSVELSAAQFQSIEKNSAILFPLSGQLFYSDAFSRRRDQPFSGTFAFGPDKRSAFLMLYNPNVLRTRE